MTTPNHLAQGFMLSYWTKKWWIVVPAILLSIAPDMGRLFQQDPHNWSLFYYWAHHAWYCFFIPFWNLHIIEDLLVHKSTGGINSWYIPLEIITWVIMIICFIKFYTRYGYKT